MSWLHHGDELTCGVTEPWAQQGELPWVGAVLDGMLRIVVTEERDVCAELLRSYSDKGRTIGWTTGNNRLKPVGDGHGSGPEEYLLTNSETGRAVSGRPVLTVVQSCQHGPRPR